MSQTRTRTITNGEVLKNSTGADPSDMEVTVDLMNEIIEPHEEVTTPCAETVAVRTRILM